MEGVRVDVIVTAELRMPHGYVFRPEGGPLTRLTRLARPGQDALDAPCLAYVLRHPEAGTILVDTGMHADAAADLRADFGPLMSIFFRGIRPADQPFDAQLRDLGVEPDEVERVVMTHLHVDHTSGMRLLPNAEFTCAREEWEAAVVRGASRAGYVGHHLPPRSRMRLIDFEREGTPHGPFERTIDLLGDGAIRLLSTPGHTRGHLSLLVRAAGIGDLLIVGDAAYTLRSIEEQIPSLLTVDGQAYRASLGALKRFADANPDATLVPTHDPTAWQAVARAPAARP